MLTLKEQNNFPEQQEQVLRTSWVVMKFECLKYVFNLRAYFQISWSGCKDSQTSADTQEAGRPIGAMTYVSIFTFSISL